MKARILNNRFAGIYTDEFLEINFNNIVNEVLVSAWNLTEKLPTENELSFYELCFDGSNWFEAAMIENVDNEKKDFYTSKLKNCISDLRIRAKGLAIGKNGSNSYIISQVDFYQRKYENSVTENPVAEIDADLAAEGLRDFGLNLVDFKNLIISMYIQGKANENLLMSFIEQGRSAILTLIDLKQWSKVDLAFDLILQLNGITSVSQARIIKNNILEL